MLVLIGCSGQQRTPKDAAIATPIAIDAGDRRTPADADHADRARPTTGDVRVRVEWANVPLPARASPGRTPCNTPRAPAIVPTTTWGVPGAIVVLSGAASEPARVVLADCALSPGVALGARLALASAVDRPARVTLAKRGEVGALDAVTVGGEAQPIQLPIAGHEVAIALEPGGVYALASGDELAWVVAAAGVPTDATGVALVTKLAVGEHQLVAWLPPRAGQPGRVARGKATIVAGDVVDVTLDLAGGKP